MVKLAPPSELGVSTRGYCTSLFRDIPKFIGLS